MSNKANRIDALIAKLAPVRDDDLVGEAHTSGAVLLKTIFASPVEAPGLESSTHRRLRVLIVAAVLALAAVLSIPALGVMREIAGLIGADEAKPVPTAAPIVVASGEAGIRWRIVAVTSDQGLCFGLYTKDRNEGWVGSASCDYVDLHGELPADVRGNPSRPCLASPTKAVPCGSLPRHWIDFARDSDPSPYYTGPGSELTRVIVFGMTAAGVASVDLALANGKTVQAHLVERPERFGAPLNFYWAALPLDWRYEVRVTEMVIARDSAGRVLERRVPAWNGNPTGDPNGPPPPRTLGD